MYKIVSKLLMYGDMPKDSILMQLSDIFKQMDQDTQSRDELVTRIFTQVKHLLQVATDYGFDKNLWHNYLTYLLITDENPFSLTCEKVGANDGSVNFFAKGDFKAFKALFDFDFSEIEERLGIDCFTRLSQYKAIGKKELMYNKNVSEKVQALSERLEKTVNEDEFFDVVTDFCLEEQSPHIMFTPYLRELRDELAGDETNPVILARRFYDFVTTKVMYSFVREYFTIECIPEYCAVNLKGDCGVQALLFITLCRMSGIPARWQSGLYATDYYTGCHDWAQFYVAPYGWVFADLSFGGNAWRAGEIERWNYYFGNLDVFRMPANSEIQKAFVPEKKWLRIDPIDNQRGEFEYEDHGLRFSQVEVSQKLISMEDIEK